MSRYYRLNTTAANIRQGSGTSYASLGFLTLNDVVQVDEPFLGGWAHLKDAQHADGSPVVLTGGGTVASRTDCWSTAAYFVEVNGLPNPPAPPEPEPIAIPMYLVAHFADGTSKKYIPE